MNGICSCNDIADEMPIFSNNHPLTFYSHTHCIFTHSLYIHPLTLQSHIHSIFTQSLCIHHIAVYSSTHSIFTHSLYSHASTLCSPNLSVFTKSLYTHLLSIYSPTHSMFTYSLYIRSTKFIVGVKTKTSQKFKQSIYSYNRSILVNMCTLSIYGMHTWDNGSRVN